MGFPRQEHWTGLPFPYPGGPSHPGVESMSPALTVLSLNHTGPPGKSDEPLGLWRKLRDKYQGLTPLPNLTELYPRPPASAGRFFTLEPPGKTCVSKKVHGEEQLTWSLNHLKRFPLDSNESQMWTRKKELHYMDLQTDCVQVKFGSFLSMKSSYVFNRKVVHEKSSWSHQKSREVKVALLSPTLCDPMDCSPWNSPGQNTGMGSLSLLQGIFPTQGSNPGLPHCRRILYQLSHQESPWKPRVTSKAAVWLKTFLAGIWATYLSPSPSITASRPAGLCQHDWSRRGHSSVGKE